MTRTVDVIFRMTRDNADLCDLYAASGSVPTLRMNADSAIHMSLSGEFMEPDPEIDWITDELKPILVIDGAEYPLGLLTVTTLDVSITETGRTLHIEAFDRGWFLRNTQTQSLLYLPANSVYTDNFNLLLTAGGITNQRITPAAFTLQTSREDWNVGTDYLKIINELADEINYYHIWFDADGFAVLEPETDPDTGIISHILDDDDVLSLMLPDVNISMDYYSSPNVFTVLMINPDKSLMTATAENDDPMSPISIQRRGRRIMKTVTVKNVGSQACLQAMADSMCSKSKLRTDRITVKTGLLPGFGLNELTALKCAGESSICIQKGWTMELVTGGTMTHNLERVVSGVD